MGWDGRDRRDRRRGSRWLAPATSPARPRRSICHPACHAFEPGCCLPALHACWCRSNAPPMPASPPCHPTDPLTPTLWHQSRCRCSSCLLLPLPLPHSNCALACLPAPPAATAAIYPTADLVPLLGDVHGALLWCGGHLVILCLLCIWWVVGRCLSRLGGVGGASGCASARATAVFAMLSPARSSSFS